MIFIVVLLVIVLVLVAGFILAKISKPAKDTPEEVAGAIEKYLSGTANPWYWDDFTTVELADKYLNDVRLACALTRDSFPPADRRTWASPEGMEVLRKLAADAREYGRTGQPPRDPRSLLASAGDRELPG